MSNFSSFLGKRPLKGIRSEVIAHVQMWCVHIYGKEDFFTNQQTHLETGMYTVLNNLFSSYDK